MMESVSKLRALPNFGKVTLDGEEMDLSQPLVYVKRQDLDELADAIEREVESNYVELPKDVNDECIRIGDTLEGKHICGGWCKSFEVRAITYDKHRCLVRDEQGFEHYTQETRHKPPAVEDVLEDYRVKYYDLVTDMEYENITNEEYVQGIKELNEMFAAKLQLREAE